MQPVTLVILPIIIIIIYLVIIYNSLVRKREQVKESSSDIEVQLKRRADLIPNLVEIVKGYSFHERELLEKITEARSKIVSSQTAQEGLAADNILESTLKTLFAVAENYPDLKANTNFLQLQKDLTDTEDKIQASRRFYNSVAQDYNSSLKIFPNNLVAKIFGFREVEYFELNYEEKEKLQKPPEIKF